MGARRSARGQSMVEFAIVMPVFLMLLFGLIDFSRLIFTYISLTNGARELARNLTISSTLATPPTAPSNAFNNLTVIAGGTQPATSVTVSASAGGSASLACTPTSSAPCTIQLSTSTPAGATSPVTVKLTGPSSTASFTASSAAIPTIQTTGVGDFVAETWLAIDGNSLPQGYIQVCQLPLTTACGVPSFASTTPRTWFSTGFVQVDVAYTFQWAPLFQNRLAGVIDAGLMRPSTLVTTSVRGYAE